MSHLIDLFLSLTAGMGYWGVFILMTIESTFLPLPSEIVIPPAAYLAYKGEMSLWIVILAGVAGSVAGALINYFLARFLGRPLVYAFVNTKWAKYIFLNEKKVVKAEGYFKDSGRLSTFIGRLIPGIRHLISIPAGFVRMPIRPFVFYTFLGSFIWVTILAVLGYAFGANQELIFKYAKMIGYGLLGLVALVLVVVALTKKKLKSS